MAAEVVGVRCLLLPLSPQARSSPTAPVSLFVPPVVVEATAAQQSRLAGLSSSGSATLPPGAAEAVVEAGLHLAAEEVAAVTVPSTVSRRFDCSYSSHSFAQSIDSASSSLMPVQSLLEGVVLVVPR